MYQPLFATLFAGRCVIDCCHSRVYSAASRQHDARRLVSGSESVRRVLLLSRRAGGSFSRRSAVPLRRSRPGRKWRTGCRQLIIFRETRQGRLRHGGDVQHIKVFAAEHHAGHFFHRHLNDAIDLALRGIAHQLARVDQRVPQIAFAVHGGAVRRAAFAAIDMAKDPSPVAVL
ncbi:Uncharacterised protein [Klebsiella pneumoniae]|nr:Uncharacterised protein [Klebsiella pneumoniae]STS20065.1 Uncharacterised protein [Klebsiella pneumoniae]STS38282.1 Uncharacterised protein [Klebsiella pneumoniae]